jgi:hypothetical protein
MYTSSDQVVDQQSTVCGVSGESVSLTQFSERRSIISAADCIIHYSTLTAGRSGTISVPIIYLKRDADVGL